jgi:hypothetical protein
MKAILKTRGALNLISTFLFHLDSTYRHDITEIVFEVALNTIKQTNKQSIWHVLLYGTCVILTGVWEMKQRLFLLRSIKFNVAQFFYHTGGIIDHHINRSWPRRPLLPY